MRSESDGHCLPRSFPGLAVRAALRRRSSARSSQCVCDRYHPSVEEFLEHVEELRERTGWDESFEPARVERVSAVDGGFELDGHGRFRHVSRARPSRPRLPRARGRPARRPRLRAARVRGRRDRRRRGHGRRDRVAERARRRLARSSPCAGASPCGARSTCRAQLFSGRGLAALPRAPARRARARCGRCSRPRSRPAARWDEPLERAARERPLPGRAPSSTAREQVVCATGFRRGFGHDPLLAGLVDEHGLAADAWILLAPDSTVPRAHRRDADAVARRRAGPVGVSGRRHARRARSTPRVRSSGGSMSFTLRGRLESRLAAALVPLPAACGSRRRSTEWWPLGSPGLMVGVGLALDIVYDRLLDYQPGGSRLPLGTRARRS